MERQQDQSTHVVGHHRHGERKGNHFRVRGNGGCYDGHHHGHKNHGRRGHEHGPRRRHGRGHGHGNGHGFVLGQEQIEHGGQMIVAHASGGEQPQPDSFGGEMIHHHRRHRHGHGHGHDHVHGHHPYHHHCHQVTETGAPNELSGVAPNELSGVMVRMHLEDEPKE